MLSSLTLVPIVCCSSDHSVHETVKMYCFVHVLLYRNPIHCQAQTISSTELGTLTSSAFPMGRKRITKRPQARQARTTMRTHGPNLRMIMASVGVPVAVVISLMLFFNHKLRPTSTETLVSSVVAEIKPSPAPVYKISIVGEYPHDRHAFTQGLLLSSDGYLYESTGLYGRSTLRKVDMKSGTVIDSRKLPDDEFGEGVTQSSENDEHLVQVMWKIGKGYVYDRVTLHRLTSFQLPGEAWGITQMQSGSKDLILSDGTSTLQILSVDMAGKVEFERTIEVKDGEKPVGLLNELEMVNGELWANVFMTDVIARIDINTGIVNSWVDCRDLLDSSSIPVGHRVDVLNGIAHDPKTDTVYITGKLWPKLFAIRVSEERVADSVSDIVNAFFLSPKHVSYVLKHMLA